MAIPAADRQPAALWSMGFRPFFLAAGVWAALALTIWIVVFLTASTLPSRFDPLIWHIHTMLFGFVLAAAAGFLLTAIPTWTGRQPVRGPFLVGLVGLWLLGRIVCLVSAVLPVWPAAAVDLAFPFVLSALAAREIISARNWRNLMIPIPIGVLGIADLLMYLELGGIRAPPGLGWRLALAAVIVLISAIGGRIIPVFTRNWLLQRGASALPREHGLIDQTALATLHAGLVGWAFLPESKGVGAVLIVAAALNVWRLGGWRGWMTASEPLLAILHLGYAWVAFGAALLGASLLSDAIPQAAALHALTAGAIGTMVLAVMTRVARGHTGRALEADGPTTLVYAAITLAGVARVAAAFANSASTALLGASAAFWLMAFLLFVATHGPMLVSPRFDAEKRFA